jgi:hypothetical protein
MVGIVSNPVRLIVIIVRIAGRYNIETPGRTYRFD